MRGDQPLARSLYRRILALYPCPFQDQVGEAMEQTFHDLYTEQQRQAAPGLFAFVVGAFLETGLGIAKEHVLAAQQGGLMRNLLAGPRAAALLGLLLALPYMLLLSLLLLGIQPNLGPLEPLLNNSNSDPPDPGSFVVFGCMALSVAAFIIARAPIARTRRAGGSLYAHPLNLLVAALIVTYLALFVIGVVVDQYPCWIGVPNCD